jgi:hypothetical protein
MKMFQRLAAARDPLSRDLKANYQNTFAALGLLFRFETNTSGIVKACEAAFHSSGLTQEKKADFTIALFEDPAFSERSPWPKPVHRGRQNLFYLCIGAENTVVADLEHRFAVGFLSPAMVSDTQILRRDLIECVAFTMATHGSGATHTYIHASAVAKRNRGLILSGPPCAGKSTLAYACAKRGFHIVADDVVYLRNEEGKLTAWGNPWRLRLVPKSLKFFPELNERFTPAEGTGRPDTVEIELDDILPGCPQSCCEPAALFFLNRSNGSTECQPLDPVRAVELISRDLISDLPEVMEKHSRAWTNLASRGAYTLHYGEDLDSAIEILEQFL